MEQAEYGRMLIEQDVHWWFLGRRRVLRALLQRHAGGAENAILEIGCGTGGNYGLLSEFGSVTGIEMDSGAATRAREAGFPLVHEGLFPGAPLDSSFDLICLFDVLEHMDDDGLALRSLAGLLNKGGKVLLTVPAHQYLFGPHDLKLHHKRRYGRSELMRVITESGLTIERCGYMNSLLFIPAFLSRVMDKRRGAAKSDGDAIPSPLVNRILENVFALERFLINDVPLPCGLSLFAVCSLE